ncbi:glycerophosphodiester phosphodiesterase family protein [Acidobacteriota bacterium]
MLKLKTDSILAALEVYDGCEFDVRLTRDRVLVIYHDATYRQKRLLNLNFDDLKDVLAFEDFIHDRKTINLVNNAGKTLWIEAKEDSDSGFKRNSGQNKYLAESLQSKLKYSKLNPKNIRIISFSLEILKNINAFLTLRIVPYIFCATDSYVPLYNHRTILHLFTSIKRHIHKTKNMGIGGLLFSKKYLKGFFSLFQPRLEKLLDMGKDNFILGTEAQTIEEERAFKDLVIITDVRGKLKDRKQNNPRLLVCHRGLFG